MYIYILSGNICSINSLSTK